MRSHQATSRSGSALVVRAVRQGRGGEGGRGVSGELPSSRTKPQGSVVDSDRKPSKTTAASNPAAFLVTGSTTLRVSAVPQTEHRHG